MSQQEIDYYIYEQQREQMQWQDALNSLNQTLQIHNQNINNLNNQMQNQIDRTNHFMQIQEPNRNLRSIDRRLNQSPNGYYELIR